MKIQSALGKVAAAALLVVLANAASATNAVVGVVAIGAPASFGGFAPAGNFVDNFIFTLPVNASTGYSVINFAPIVFGGSFNTVFSSLTLMSDPDSVLSNSDDVAIAHSNGSSANSLSFTTGSLPAGHYYLQVVGFTSGSLGGLYTGAISVSTASPVPELDSYAMLLAGLGVIGSVAMRRKHKK